jgi:hypothetical protein
MIIQMMGMDAETREKVGRAFASKIDAWYLDSKDLPMGHTQPQQARWLRVVAKAYDRNNRGHIVTSGFFATAESREQYRIEAGRQIPDFSVYIDTIPHDQFHLIPGYVERVVNNVDDHTKDEMQRLDYWEEPAESDYDLIIKDASNIEEVTKYIFDEYVKKMSNYKVVTTEWKNA